MRWCSRPVVPDAGGQGEQALGDAGEHPVWGTGAVGFQAELALEGVVDGLDPLSDSAEVAVAGFSSRSGRSILTPSVAI